MKRILLVIMLVVMTLIFTACDDASIVSENLSREADQFKVLRKVIFYNGITDEYMFAIEGFCSIEADTVDVQLEVTCKIGEDKYEKHFLGLSDNVSYMVLQLEAINVSAYHYKIYLKPQALIPEIEVLTED